MGLFRRLRSTFRTRRVDDQIDDELRFHIEQRMASLIASGLSPEDAGREAARLFGNRTHVADSTRDRDILAGLQSILQDLRFATRNLRRSKAFAAVAILSLAFGIGVNAAIFTLVDGVLLEKLPLADAGQIVQIHAKLPQFAYDRFNVPVLRELQRQREIFQEVIGFNSSPVSAAIGGETHRLRAEFVTGGYFPFFRATPALGRLLDENDDRTEGAGPVCVLSYDAWQNLFGGDPGVLRQTLRIRQTVLTIVGVAPPGFAGGELQNRYDLFLPTSESNALVGIPRDSANYIYLGILARLQPGRTRQPASARLTAASRSIEAALPKDRANSGASYQLLDASRGYDSWRSQLRDPLLILMGAVSLVLLVACANLANLLLARAAGRRQEFAIKLAIGIGRWRLMRQLLVEIALVTVAGGALALFLGALLTRALLAIFNAGYEFSVLNVSPHTSVLWFTFGACLFTTLVAGLYPAWKAARIDPVSGFQASSAGGRHGLLRRTLILVQVALAVVLLFGASLFTHSLRNLKTIDLGYRIDHVLSVQVGAARPLQGFEGTLDPPEMRDLLDRVRHIPGIEAAAFSNPGTLAGVMIRTTIQAGGREVDDTTMIQTSPGYFSTMGMPILAGRDFSAADTPAAPLVAIVNHRMAALAWPGRNPVGQHLADDDSGKEVEVIGVVADSRDHAVRVTADPIVYQPFSQKKTMGGALEIRYRGSQAAIESAVRQAVKSQAPDYQVSRASSMELMRDQQISQERLLAFLSSLFGLLGTTLALVGIYGLIAYSVSRRTREIGIRMSVGARGRDVLLLFLREASLLLALGTGAGLPLAFLLARFVGKLLYQVPTLDAGSVTATVALIATGGIAASLIPARRAARVDPQTALRAE